MTLSRRIAAQISATHNVERVKADALVNFVFEAIANAVVSGDWVILPGVGQFKTVTTVKRYDYNPSTGEPIITVASSRVIFEPAP